MDVRCERCRAQYVVDGEQVTPAGLAVQCTTCGHVFKVKKKELVVTVPVKPHELDVAPIPANAVVPKPRPSPPPVRELDLAAEARPAPRRDRPRAPPRWALAAVLVGAAGAGAYVLGPALFAPPPAPREPSEAIAIEVKGDPAPAPPPPQAAAEPAPSPEPARAAPASTGAGALLAEAHRLHEKGDAQAALELFGRVASDDPRNAKALTGRGLCYLDLEKYAPAEASFSAALQIDPGEADALLGLAETYRFQGKKAEAISHYEKYLARHPDGEEVEVARNALAELR